MNNFYINYGKRILDFVLAFTGLVVLTIPLIFVVFLSVLFIGLPITFKQERIGLNNKKFDIIKLRSMTNAKDDKGNLLPDADRLTRYGKFIRATSLDEVTGLINVLKGEMSLVGPRPLLVEYLPLYSKEQIRRHDVKPGITGLAQINGRNAISWDDKFKLDVKYVDNLSLGMDMKILLLTVKKVILKEGISSNEHVTMEKFTGNENK